MMNYLRLERHIISVVLFCIAVSLGAAADEQREAIDTQRRSLTVHVGKAGLFSAAAQNTG